MIIENIVKRELDETQTHNSHRAVLLFDQVTNLALIDLLEVV